jgi:hypothetical protein
MMHRLHLLAIRWTVALTALVMSASVWSWGAEGHQAVADLAGARLSPAALAEVTRLLALEPGATLASISTWPDEVRAPTTAKWHYVNFEDDGCHYDEARHCPGGQCVVGAIERQTLLLESRAADIDRLKALKYVVHFVADVHQPLHAGYAHDRGGNQFQVRWNDHGTNLHALWDVGLIQTLSKGQDGLASLVQARSSQPPPASTLASWAEASCRIVQTPGFYPDTAKPGLQYLHTYGELVLNQIDLAAWRLAAVLNDTLR